MNTWDKCKNCGGERGLHHYETDQCPVGGREAPVGRRQEWKTTTFEIDDSDKDARIAELEAELKWAWDNMRFTAPPAAEDSEYDFCLVCGCPEWEHDEKCEAKQHKAQVAALLDAVPSAKRR